MTGLGLNQRRMLMSDIQIRTGQAVDIPTLVNFNAAMAKETEGLILDRETLTHGVQSLLNDPQKGFYLVLEVDHRVRASLMITYEWSDWRNGLFWWIQSVYVDPEYRKQNLFKQMYTHIYNLVKKDNTAVGLRLYVDNDNEIAQNVYTSLGMHQTNYYLFEQLI